MTMLILLQPQVFGMLQKKVRLDIEVQRHFEGIEGEDTMVCCKNCGKKDPKLHNEFGSFCDEICFGTWQHKDKLRMMGR